MADLGREDQVLAAEVLPSETEEQALARVERRAQALANPHATIELPLPSGTQIVPTTRDEFRALAEDDLYIAFYNMSGRIPDRDWDFSGLDDITIEERQQIARYGQRYQGVRSPTGARMHHYITDGTPMTVEQRVTCVPLERDRRNRDVIRARLKWPATAWITHFSIGSRKSVIVAGQLNKPWAVLPGNALKFGIRISDLMPRETVQKALETGAIRKQLTDGSRPVDTIDG